MLSTRSFLACACIATSAASASAQQIAGGNFATLRQTPAYQKSVVSGAYKTPAWLNDSCPNARPSISAQITVRTIPVRVSKQLQPQSGAWIEHVAVANCHRAWQLNVLFEVVVPGTIVTVALLPGTTHADPILQKDAATLVLAAAGIDPAGCKPIYIADAVFLRNAEGPQRLPGRPAWAERWSIKQCDRKTDIDVRFTPDRTGTAIAVSRAAQPI